MKLAKQNELPKDISVTDSPAKMLRIANLFSV